MSNRADQLLQRALDLLKNNDSGSGQQLLEDAGAAGSVQAFTELAYLNRSRGDMAAADRYMARAAKLADDNKDGFGHLDCALAYQIGNSSCGHEESSARAREHLEKAAKLNISGAQKLLAHEHLLGLNGAEIDRGKYDYWIARAIELGDDDALLGHIENLLKLGEPVSDELRMRLSQNTTQPERTRKLQRKVNYRSTREPK
jgi:hypothetical protein